MFELQINNDEIESIFELLGEKEDDLTFSLAWMMKQNKHLFSKIIRKAIGKFKFENVIINLQNYNKDDGGYTDIEILIDNKWFIIIEAKKGWIVPTKKQIKKYIEPKAPTTR